tara:strand:- start:773 stop:1021 length:249 start_codon:yes stop_codon:yes gene_type:complete
MNKIISELDGIIFWPKKVNDKQLVIEWLSDKFEFDKKYSEKEINQIIDSNHSFNDTPLLRRELISRSFLKRKDDGSIYWRVI